MRTEVITYHSPNGGTIDLSLEQIELLETLGTWPKDYEGREFCQVSHGQHSGSPSMSTRDLLRYVGEAETATAEEAGAA